MPHEPTSEVAPIERLTDASRRAQLRLPRSFTSAAHDGPLDVGTIASKTDTETDTEAGAEAEARAGALAPYP